MSHLSLVGLARCGGEWAQRFIRSECGNGTYKFSQKESDKRKTRKSSVIFCLLVVLIIIQSNSALSIPPDYVSYWKFDGNANDEAGINNGTLVGNARIINDTERGFVLSLGGSSYVNVNDDISLRPESGSWTISVWAKSENRDQIAPIVTKRQPNSPYEQYSLLIAGPDSHSWTSGRKIVFDYIEDTVDVERSGYTTNNIIDGSWHHIVMTANQSSDTVRIYVDGSEETVAVDHNHGSWPTINNADNLRIGNNNARFYFIGRIDDIMIYNRVLTETETFELYNAQLFKYEIDNPISGAILNHNYDEDSSSPGVEFTIAGTINVNNLTINGEQVHVSGGTFSKLVDVTETGENDFALVIKNSAGETKNIVRTYYFDKDSFRRYHFSIDDALNMFYELDVNENQWESIFEQDEFAFLKQMHDSYGSKFSLYLFFENSAWSLADMTGKYKSEFQENSDWLKFSFHAKASSPKYPYTYASYKTAYNDFNLIKNEVIRFAGAETWSSFMRSHFWSGSLDAVRAWRDLGMKGFLGSDYYTRNHKSYYMEIGSEEWDYTHSNDYWKDINEGVYFLETDVCFENIGDVVSFLSNLANEPKQSEIIELFIHDYGHGIQSSIEQASINEALNWLTQQGYVPIFYDEGFLGNDSLDVT